MAFRIGKSVMMNFGDDLEPIFIFAGLAFLLLIGPFLRWYTLGMTKPNFKFLKTYFLELIPFFLVFVMSFFITKESFENDRIVIILLSSVLLFIYLHFAFYIGLSWKILRDKRREVKNEAQTKSQKAIFDWLKLVVIGFVVIWISYFLNLIEESVPYIIGPIMYSVIIYFLSYKAFELKATEIDGDAFKLNNDLVLFNQISKLIIDDELYLKPDLTLSKLSNLIGESTQKTSSIINEYGKRNFNDFINYYRVEEAKKMLLDSKNEKFTISSIAFEIGFGSLSSFNSAFKKFEGITPSNFRKNR
ncbi:AraC family transcriptional regulator [Tenacibaculum aiptasiae]|uniref:AraC family transcriptional regulator n=1 Tax=Tenacibaculum aiptasiae TaxID=426481 RepID=A0A7J5ATT9_9FLAO|nr:helix-turn-helix domain-containing protein [Tenacibaculum aiptasiae]KAB1160360.1 AraC family transcriptional regulator [Tenacibaculum aiptasiae]